MLSDHQLYLQMKLHKIPEEIITEYFTSDMTLAEAYQKARAEMRLPFLDERSGHEIRRA